MMHPIPPIAASTRRIRRPGGSESPRGGASTLHVLAVIAALFAMSAGSGGCERSASSHDGEPASAGPAAGASARPANLAQPQAEVPPVEPAPRPTDPLPPGTGCMTSTCHASFGVARQIHGAVAAGDCFVCHAADTGNHTYPLTRPGNASCTFCHKVGGTRANQHEALIEPGCIACHDPHVSRTKFLLVSDSVEVLCLQCHLLEPGTNAHGPFAAGECTACHDPHESDATGLLRGGAGPEHCYMCHAETRYVMENAPFVHEPARDDCTSCHSPHATNFEHALKLPIEQTCFTCHKELEVEVTGATAPHAAVFTAESCANCHDPHAAGRPKLLRERQDVLCLQCHDQEIKVDDGRVIRDMKPALTEREFLHGPVASGDCSACHNVHGASQARLLKQMFTEAFYESFDVGSYALCFQCHPRELVLAERTDTLTDFRDGDLNLHFLHVNREQKGRTCRTCHEIHGSDLTRQMAATVPFEGSQWALPIGFTRTDGGGRCAPGCHEPMDYRRLVQPNAGDQAPTGGAP